MASLLKTFRGWGYNSVVKWVPRIWKALGLICSTRKLVVFHVAKCKVRDLNDGHQTFHDLAGLLPIPTLGLDTFSLF